MGLRSQCRNRYLSSGIPKCILLISDTVSDGLGNQNNRLVVTPPLPKPEALDTTVADEYSIDTAGNTAQTSAACPAMNGIKNLSNQDERGKTTTEEGPLPILDPSDSLRQRKQISVESSDSSGNKSPTPPATSRCLLQLFLHCLQTVWSVLLGGKANRHRTATCCSIPIPGTDGLHIAQIWGWQEGSVASGHISEGHRVVDRAPCTINTILRCWSSRGSLAPSLVKASMLLFTIYNQQSDDYSC